MSISHETKVWTRRQALWLLTGVTGGLALHGCAQKTGTNANSSSSSDQASTSSKTLTVGVNAWPGYSSQFIALEKEFFKAEGIDVKETFFQDGSSAITAFLAGKIDVTWNTSGDLVQMADKDPSIKMIMLVDYSNGSDGIIGRGITKPQDLKGKKIARENLVFENILLQNYLEKGGLTFKDVTLIDAPAAAAATAFISKQVDAAVTYEPYLTKAAKEGSGAVIFTTKGTNLVADVLITRDKVIKEQKEVLLAYLRAVDKAVKLVNSGTEEALKISAKKLGVSPKEAKEQIAGIRIFDIEGNKKIGFNPSDKNNIMENLKLTVKIATESKVISKSLDVKTLYDDSLVKAL